MEGVTLDSRRACMKVCVQVENHQRDGRSLGEIVQAEKRKEENQALLSCLLSASLKSFLRGQWWLRPLLHRGPLTWIRICGPLMRIRICGPLTRIRRIQAASEGEPDLSQSRSNQLLAQQRRSFPSVHVCPLLLLLLLNLWPGASAPVGFSGVLLLRRSGPQRRFSCFSLFCDRVHPWFLKCQKQPDCSSRSRSSQLCASF